MNYKLLLPSYRARFRFVQDALDGLLPNRHVGRGLSLGTGEGDYDRVLAQYCDRLDACDLNEDDVAYATELNRDVSNLFYSVEDGTALRYDDASFDLVVCLEVIEHVDDPDRLITEIRRVLKPGGWLVLTCPSHHFPFTYDPVNRLLRGLGRRAPFGAYGYGHTWLVDAPTLRRDLVAAGFEVAAVSYLSKSLVGLIECYVPGMLQRLLKGNATNTAGHSKAARMRPSTRVPALAAVTDTIIRVDNSLFARSRRSIGLGYIARRA